MKTVGPLCLVTLFQNFQDKTGMVYEYDSVVHADVQNFRICARKHFRNIWLTVDPVLLMALQS